MHLNVEIGEHLLPLRPEHETTICFDPLSLRAVSPQLSCPVARAKNSLSPVPAILLHTAMAPAVVSFY